MTTTMAWLQSKRWAHLAFSLVFDGYDLIYTTTKDTAGILTAFSGTDWTVCKGGLDIIGEIRQRIELFDPRITPSRLTFRLLDRDDVLAHTLGAPNRAGAGDWTTYLTDNVTPTGSQFNVKDTSGFASSGVYYLGQESGTWGSKTSTKLDTLTRGKWALFGTSASSTRYKRYHRLQPGARGQRAVAPAVSNYPRTFYNRIVGLYLHHREGGAWSTKANSILLYAGRIKGWGEDGTGWWELATTGAQELLFGQVFGDQFTAQLGFGAVSKTAVDKAFRLYAQVNDSIGAQNYDSGTTATNLTTTGVRYTWADICTQIQNQMSAWQTGGQVGSRHRWSVALEPDPNGKHTVVIRMNLIGATNPNNTFSDVAIGMSERWWTLLGADLGAGDVQTAQDTNGQRYPIRRLKVNSSSEWMLRLEHAPLEYVDPSQFGTIRGKEFEIYNVRGTWLQQPIDGLSVRYRVPVDSTYPNGAEGFVQIGTELLAIDAFVPDSDPTTGILHVHDRCGPDFDDTATAEARNVYAGGSGESPKVTQCWYEMLTAGEMLLRLMCSTGSAGYNHADYDVYPVGFGLGIPFGLVDEQSFLTLEDRYELTLEKPKPLRDLLEALMAATGRYCIWRNGKITLTYPGFDTPSVENIIVFNEANKGKPSNPRKRADRSPISYAPDSIINGVLLKTGSGELTKIETPSFGDRAKVHTTIVDNVPSISDFGARKRVEIECIGLQDPKSAKDYVIAPAMAFFSRPVGHIQRSINGKLLGTYPGDIGKLTDNTLIDPRTGNRGIAGLAVRVVEHGFDFKKGCGEVDLVFLPEHTASRYTTWAPSGFITAYNTGTKVLTLSAHGFSRTTAVVDAQRYPAGSKVAIQKIGVAGGTRYTAEVASNSPGANTVTLTTDPTGGAGLDFTNFAWVLEFDAISVCITAQRDRAFIGDDPSGSQPTTGLVSDDAFLFAGPNNEHFLVFDSAAPNYTQPFVKPVDAASDQGRPYSTHLAYYQILSCNNLLGHSTCAVHLNDNLPTELTHNATTWKLVYLVKIPLFGVDVVHNTARMPSNQPRQLRGRVRLRRTSGSGTDARCRVTSCQAAPFDTADMLDVTFEGGKFQTSSIIETATTGKWSSEFTLSPAIVMADPTPYTWIAVEITETGGATAGFSGIVLGEKPLS